MAKWSVVIPTNRPEQLVKFLEAWDLLFTKYSINLVIVQDLPKDDPLILKAIKGREYEITLLNWRDIKTRYIPTRTDMVRSWGFYHVWANHDVEYVLTLDDDVVPSDDVFLGYQTSFEYGATLSDYFDVGSLTSSKLNMRGYPYKDRARAKVAVQYGGWNGVLDYDAATQLSIPRKSADFKPVSVPLPRGVPTTCCIMNAAWKVEYTPIMWQLPMLDGRYNRVGDIWSGLFIKKVLDAIGDVMMINGDAKVVHDRASDPYNSLKKEAPSAWLNDNLWDNLSDPISTDTEDAYKEVTNSAVRFFYDHDEEYAKHFIKARNEWMGLYETPSRSKV